MATLEALQQRVIRDGLLIRDLNERLTRVEADLGNLIQKHNSLFFLVTLHGISLKEALELLTKKGVMSNEELEAVKNAGTTGLKNLVNGSEERPETGDSGNGNDVPVQGHASAGGIVDATGRDISGEAEGNPPPSSTTPDSSVNT